MVNTEDRPVRGEARSAILEAADRLFYRDGIRAVGVDTVAAEAGITKRTLYYHFPTKEALVGAYLSRHDELNRGPLTEQAEQFGPLPGDHVLGLFEAFAVRFDLPGYRGCAFLNAAAESGSDLLAVRECVTEHKDAVRDWTEAKLSSAGAGDARDLAEQLMLLLDGALIRVLLYPGSGIVRRAQSAADALLRIAGVRVSSPEGRVGANVG